MRTPDQRPIRDHLFVSSCHIRAADVLEQGRTKETKSRSRPVRVCPMKDTSDVQSVFPSTPCPRCALAFRAPFLSCSMSQGRRRAAGRPAGYLLHRCGRGCRHAHRHTGRRLDPHGLRAIRTTMDGIGTGFSTWCGMSPGSDHIDHAVVSHWHRDHYGNHAALCRRRLTSRTSGIAASRMPCKKMTTVLKRKSPNTARRRRTRLTDPPRGRLVRSRYGRHAAQRQHRHRQPRSDHQHRPAQPAR